MIRFVSNTNNAQFGDVYYDKEESQLKVHFNNQWNVLDSAIPYTADQFLLMERKRKLYNIINKINKINNV